MPSALSRSSLGGSFPRVFVTGVGGAAGIAVLKALAGIAELFAGDMDVYAAGLYLVPEDHAFIIPSAADPDYVPLLEQLLEENQIHVLFPTVDAEILTLVRERKRFEADIIASDLEAVETCLDKNSLIEKARELGLAPASILLSEYQTQGLDVLGAEFPLLIKPRQGRGSEGVETVESQQALQQMIQLYQHQQTPLDDLLLQEYLPGAEYSLDVIADQRGNVRAVVPRERLKVDSGIAVAARTVKDPELEQLGKELFEAAGLNGIANVQVRRNTAGAPKLLEINPRFPGTLALTIASGINAPLLLLEEALGQPLPDKLEWEPKLMVRYLEDQLLSEDGSREFMERLGEGAQDDPS